MGNKNPFTYLNHVLSPLVLSIPLLFLLNNKAAVTRPLSTVQWIWCSLLSTISDLCQTKMGYIRTYLCLFLNYIIITLQLLIHSPKISEISLKSTTKQNLFFFCTKRKLKEEKTELNKQCQMKSIFYSFQLTFRTRICMNIFYIIEINDFERTSLLSYTNTQI